MSWPMYLYGKITSGFFWITSYIYDVKSTVQDNHVRLEHIEEEMKEIQKTIRTYLEEEKELRKSVHEELVELIRLRSIQERS
jgi:hypothetical protein